VGLAAARSVDDEVAVPDEQLDRPARWRERERPRAARLARRAAPIFRLAYRRVAARLGPVALVAIGTAIAAGALATILTARVVVEDRALADEVATFPVDQRAVTMSWVGNDAADLRSLDGEARRAVQSLGLGRPTRAVVFRTLRLGTELVRLAALDDLTGLVEVRSGHLPAPCRPGACELVALDAPTKRLDARGFTVVGSATERSGAPVAALLGSRTGGERVLLANGVEGVLAQSVVANVFRTVTWLVPLEGDALDTAGLGDFERRVTRASTDLRVHSPGFDVRAPLEELTAAGREARLAGRHGLLVAGQFVALFLVFAVLAAARMRRDARETNYRLRRFGARRWQVLAETTAHAAIVVVPSVLVGWLAGIAVGAGIAAAADRPAPTALERSSISADGVAWALALAAVGIAVIVIAVRARSIEIRGFRLTTADVAAIGAVAVVVAAVGTGQTDAGSVEGSGALLLLLPVLIAFAAAVVVARLLGPAFRLAERAAPTTRVSIRLALLSLVRNPGPAAFAVAFLVVAAGLAVFAETYRATLAQNQQDTAAYAVPLDYVVRRDAVRGRGLGGPIQLANFYSGQIPVGVVRRKGDAPSLNRRERLTVLGLPATAFERLRWREDYSGDSRAELARTLGAGPRPELRGVRIPRGTREVVFPAVVRGDPVRITAAFRRPDGSFAQLELRGASGSPTRTVRLPAGVTGGILVGLTLAFPPNEAFGAAHRAAETEAAPDVFVRGDLRLGAPLARGPQGLRPLAVDYRDWVRPDGSGTGGSRSSLTLRYLLTQERPFRVRLRQPTDGHPIPVIASTSLVDAVGEGATLPLDVGEAETDVLVAATARRFPTLRGDFLVADLDALETALNASAPGAAVADEVWLDGPQGEEQELRRAAPVPVSIASRVAIEERLRADPVSRSASISLGAGVLVALALALAGVLLAVAIDLRDEASELFDLEALGFGPSELARHVWLRALAVVALGIIGGLLTGALIALVVTNVVELTANATEAEPPLRLAVDWIVLVGGLVVFAAVTLASVVLLARSAFRAAVPARAERG
jgi:hypothetical protein